MADAAAGAGQQHRAPRLVGRGGRHEQGLSRSTRDQFTTMVGCSVRDSCAPNSDGNCCWQGRDRKSTRLNSSHQIISYAVFCLKKKKKKQKLENKRRGKENREREKKREEG